MTPYLTNSSSDVAAQAATTVSGGAFTGTIPARSLVTFEHRRRRTHGRATRSR